jgi:serine/threonine protein kinase
VLKFFIEHVFHGAMKFLHRFGLIHGGPKSSNTLFDEHHRIQTIDCGRSLLDMHESATTARGVASKFAAPEMQSGEDSNAKIDGFSSEIEQEKLA